MCVRTLVFFFGWEVGRWVGRGGGGESACLALEVEEEDGGCHCWGEGGGCGCGLEADWGGWVSGLEGFVEKSFLVGLLGVLG